MITTGTPVEATMLAAKGAAYVAAWPGHIARQVGCTADLVAEAVRVMFPAGTTVGDLTPMNAHSVIGYVRHHAREAYIAAGGVVEDVTHCRGCGLRLDRNGGCGECGSYD